MISHKYKIIFVHINKNGGDTIEKALWADSEINRKNLFGFPNPYQTGGLQHLFAKHIRSEVGEKIFNQYFKFSFVRNPWSRALSQYFYTIQFREDLQKMLKITKESSFKEYLYALRKSYLYVQWEKQYKFILDDEGKLMVDFLGKTENLQDDFDKICDKIGIPKKRLPVLNKTIHKHYTEYYDEESIAIISDLYKEDINLFGYSFGDP